MTIRINHGVAPGPPTTRGMLGSLYENILAGPPQAAEPMGNSIRRLLNATQGNQPGWTKLPMQQFSDAETAGSTEPQMPMGTAGPTWGTATPAASPTGGPDSAWTEGLPDGASSRPQTAREARDAYEAYTLQEKLRNQRAWDMYQRGLGPHPRAGNPRNAPPGPTHNDKRMMASGPAFKAALQKLSPAQRQQYGYD